MAGKISDDIDVEQLFEDEGRKPIYRFGLSLVRIQSPEGPKEKAIDMSLFVGKSAEECKKIISEKYPPLEGSIQTNTEAKAEKTTPKRAQDFVESDPKRVRHSAEDKFAEAAKTIDLVHGCMMRREWKALCVHLGTTYRDFISRGQQLKKRIGELKSAICERENETEFKAEFKAAFKRWSQIHLCLIESLSE